MTRLDSALIVMLGNGTMGMRLEYVYVARTVTVLPTPNPPSPWVAKLQGVPTPFHQQRSTVTALPTMPVADWRTRCTTSAPVGSSEVIVVPVAGPVERPSVGPEWTIAYRAPSRVALLRTS